MEAEGSGAGGEEIKSRERRLKDEYFASSSMQVGRGGGAGSEDFVSDLDENVQED